MGKQLWVGCPKKEEHVDLPILLAQNLPTPMRKQGEIVKPLGGEQREPP